MPQVGLNTVYELIVVTDIGSGLAKNVLNYLSNDPTPSSDDWSILAGSFNTTVIPVWVDTISVSASITRLEVRRLDSIIDFGVLDLSIPGTRVGTQAPSYVTAPLKKLRTTKETGSGRVAIGRLAKDDYAGDVIDATLSSNLGQLGLVLVQQLTGVLNGFDPVIVGNKKDSAGNPVPEADWLFQDWDTFEIPTLVSTQNSRKANVGE